MSSADCYQEIRKGRLSWKASGWVAIVGVMMLQNILCQRLEYRRCHPFSNLQSVQWLSDYKLWRCIQTHPSQDMIKLDSSLPVKIYSYPLSLFSPSLPTSSPSQHSNLHYSWSPAMPAHQLPLTLFFFFHFHSVFWANLSVNTSISPIRDRSVTESCEAPV